MQYFETIAEMGHEQVVFCHDKASGYRGIIAIHDTKYRTVKPIFRTSGPSRVMTIIDGQHRICTLVMLNISLHDFLRRQVQALSTRKQEPFVWAVDQCQVMLAALEDTFQIDMRTGDKRHRFYPRVTRAYDDAWSKREAEARYESPIARLIWEYIAFDKTNPKCVFKKWIPLRLKA